MLAALALGAGCGSSAGDGGVGGTGGSGGTGGDGPTAVDFIPGQTLELTPLEAVDLQIRVRPPARYPVRFSLNGNSRDASLAATTLHTDAEGLATTTLFAPSQVASFTVRATVGNEVSAALAVAVSELGFGTLRITPSYGGQRQVSTWTASVHTERRCTDLSGTPPPDGALWAHASPGEALRLGSVPAGSFYAVTLRASQFAGGCTDLPSIVAGEEKAVSVQVFNRPLQLDQVQLSVMFGVSPEESDWEVAHGAAKDAALTALIGDSEHDVDALLDAMAERAGADAQLLIEARAVGDWDARVHLLLGDPAERALRDALGAWIDRGTARLVGPDVLSAALSASAAGPMLQLRRVAGLTPTVAGFSEQVTGFGFSADPDDSLLFGGTLSYLPTRLALAAAEQHGLDTPGDLAAALSAVVDCAALSQDLASADEPHEVFSGCDLDCAEQLCLEAVSELVERARAASDAAPVKVMFSATALAEVDSEARPSGFTGTWVGELTGFPQRTLRLSGTSRGQRPGGP